MSGHDAQSSINKMPLVIIGDSAFAEIALEMFTEDSEFEVVGFSVERDYLRSDELHGLPIIPLEDLETYFTPGECWFFVAVVYTEMNGLRKRLYEQLVSRGYQAASFISRNAHVASSARIGNHCFIFEDNTIQSYATIGNNVILWSGNHIGHHSRIENHVFVSSHVVISGFSVIGENSFLGVNATISNNVVVGRDNWISPGVVILKSTAPDSLVRGLKPNFIEGSARALMGRS